MDPFWDVETGEAGLAPGWSVATIFDDDIDRFDVDYLDGVPPLVGLPPAFSRTPSAWARLFLVMMFLFAAFKSPSGQQAMAAVPPTVTLLARVGFLVAEGLYNQTKYSAQNAWPPSFFCDRRELSELRARLPALEVQAQELRVLVPELEGLRDYLPLLERELQGLRGKVPSLEAELVQLRADAFQLQTEAEELRSQRVKTASLEEELAQMRKLYDLRRQTMLVMEDKMASIEAAYGELVKTQTWPMVVAETVVAVMHPAVLIVSKASGERGFVRMVSSAARELDVAAEQAMASMHEGAEEKTLLEGRVKQLLLDTESLEEEIQARDRALSDKDKEITALRAQLSSQKEAAVHCEALHKSELDASVEVEQRLGACAGAIKVLKTQVAAAEEGPAEVLVMEAAVAEPPVESTMEAEEQLVVVVTQQPPSTLAGARSGLVKAEGNDTETAAPSSGDLDVQHAKAACEEQLARSMNVTDKYRGRVKVLEEEIDDHYLEQMESIAGGFQVVATLVVEIRESYDSLSEVVGECHSVLGAEGARVEAALQQCVDLEIEAYLALREHEKLFEGMMAGANQTAATEPPSGIMDLQRSKLVCEEQLSQSNLLTAQYLAWVDVLEEQIQSLHLEYERSVSMSEQLVFALLYKTAEAYASWADVIGECQTAMGGYDPRVEAVLQLCADLLEGVYLALLQRRKLLEGAK